MPCANAALRLVLALILALTSVHVAVARADAGTVTWVEICAGTVAVPMAVDAKGNPVKPHPTCPDCVVAAGLLPVGVGMAAPLVRGVPEGRVDSGAQRRGPAALVASARGPPALV